MEERLEEAGYNVLRQPQENGLSPRLAVVSRIDDSVVRFMEGGGSVLFLARSPDDIEPSVSQRTGLRVRDRRARLDENTKEKNPWEGDWISNFSWVKHDPLFEEIPRSTESPLAGDLLDMQYYRVMPNQVLLGWGQEKEFSDIHSGMVVGWVHAPASLLAQCKWGSGKLLATTLKLESGYGDDPVATVLLNNLIGYLGSTRFRPQKDALAPRRTVKERAAEPGIAEVASVAAAGRELEAAAAHEPETGEEAVPVGSPTELP
jgi:hypothetical protein